MGTEKNKAMAALQTIFVAILLGVISWLSLSTVSSRDRLLKLETQLEERGPRIQRIEELLNQVKVTQEGVLRTLIEQKDRDEYLGHRLDILEQHKP